MGGLAMRDATLKQVLKFLEIFGNLSSEKMQEVLGSGLLADLRDGDVKNVDRDAVRKLLKLPLLTKQPVKLLQFLGTVTVSARTEEFVARNHFIVDTSENAKVKISYLGGRFSNNFLGKIEKPMAKSTLRYGKLLRRSVDDPIPSELGGKANAETTLSEMFGCMELQPNGEKHGALLTNGYVNIFYICDDSGVLWAVSCRWRGGGWGVDADSVEALDEWSAGDQAFSRNPSVS
jgi:hypothetical protein